MCASCRRYPVLLANCKYPDRLSRQRLIPNLKRLFTRDVFTQNSILLRTSE
jgi:hypothetical protein